MKFAFIATALLIPALAKPVPYKQNDSVFSNYDEAYLDQSLSEYNTAPEDNFFGVTWVLEKAVSLMAPPVIDKCIEFLEAKKKDATEANKDVSTKFKDHQNVLTWLKAISPNMIDAALKILRVAKGAVSSFDDDNFGEYDYNVANTVEELGNLTPEFLKNYSNYSY